MHKIHQNTFGAELMRSSRPNSRNGGLLLRKGGRRRGRKGPIYKERQERGEKGGERERKGMGREFPKVKVSRITLPDSNPRSDAPSTCIAFAWLIVGKTGSA